MLLKTSSVLYVGYQDAETDWYQRNFIHIVKNKIQQLCIVISRNVEVRIVFYVVKALKAFSKISLSASTELAIWVLSTAKLMVLDFFFKILKIIIWGLLDFPKMLLKT